MHSRPVMVKQFANRFETRGAINPNQSLTEEHFSISYLRHYMAGMLTSLFLVSIPLLAVLGGVNWSPSVPVQARGSRLHVERSLYP